MKRTFKGLFIAVLFGGVGLYVGCSKVKFDTVPLCPELVAMGENVTCESNGDGWFRVSETKRTGRVDILFVDDNSGSMFEEQEHMGSKFPNFLSGGISQLDYQIAIITTDVSASPKNDIKDARNGFGAYQDGKLLMFPNNQLILNNQTANVESMFQQTIERQETKDCETDRSKCPSGDERAIYALNLALDRGNTQFFRSTSHLAVVILSDEDERSNGGELSGYPLEPYDLPETFVQKVRDQLGFTKTVSVHSVVIRPGDTYCQGLQEAQQNASGFYANIYKQLSQPSAELQSLGSIVPGEMGSICSQNYAIELGDIAAKISQNVNVHQLVCAPRDGDVEITLTPYSGQDTSYSIDSNNQLVLDSPVGPGIDVNFTYSCSTI